MCLSLDDLAILKLALGGVKSVKVVGSDTFGEDYLENFRKNNIDIENVLVTSEASTGVAPIIVDDNGQNAIIIVAGANLLLTPDEVYHCEAMIRQAKIAVFQLEISTEATIAGLEVAKKHGLKTIVNPAPAKESLPETIYNLSDIFCPNETEAEILTKQQIQSIDDAKEAIETLLARGCKTVIITMGEMGSVFKSAGMLNSVHVPAEKIIPVDTTGAGDAFVGALAYYLVRYPTVELEDAIRKSSRVATLSVKSKGTQTSYPSHEELSDDLL